MPGPTPLVVVYHGSLAALAAVTAAVSGSRRIGLFQNDWQPQPNQTITAVVPATFSGYDGLHDLLGWTLPLITGDQAVSTGDERVWTHNGGLVSNWVYGIYVVDGAGGLLWAQRVWDPPIAMAVGGAILRYVPTLTFKTSYAGR